MLPKEKYVVVLDSKSGDFVKPAALKALAKMGSLLKELDSSLDLGQWRFIVNRKEDIPQQNNDYDCGVFTCMYARSLVGHSPLISLSCISAYRKIMLLDLHLSILHPLPPNNIQPEKYYAVEYEENYYIGRALCSLASSSSCTEWVQTVLIGPDVMTLKMSTTRVCSMGQLLC